MISPDTKHASILITPPYIHNLHQFYRGGHGNFQKKKKILSTKKSLKSLQINLQLTKLEIYK